MCSVAATFDQQIASQNKKVTGNYKPKRCGMSKKKQTGTKVR